MKSPWGSNMLGFRNSFSGLDLRPWWHTECWMWWPPFLRATWSRNLLLHLPLFIRVHVELRARTWVLSLNWTSSGIQFQRRELLHLLWLERRSLVWSKPRFVLQAIPDMVSRPPLFFHPWIRAKFGPCPDVSAPCVALFQLPCLVSKRPFKLLLLSQPSVV